MTAQQEHIKIEGAKVHNLKNIDLEIPREKLVVEQEPSSMLAFASYST